jgi:hypothetical protein
MFQRLERIRVAMRQYTNEIQTAKLIELGLPRPKGWNIKNISSRFVMAVDVDADNEFNYSIGELIEILENAVQKDNFITDLDISCDEIAWLVIYISEGVGRFKTQMPDLIDALYLMVVKLKEEGVI